MNGPESMQAAGIGKSPSRFRLHLTRHVPRPWAVSLLLFLLLAVMALRGMRWADRLEWWHDYAVWRLTLGEGAMNFRHESLVYDFPGWERASEPLSGVGADYRSQTKLLGRDIDRRFGGFELAAGTDQVLEYWGYRATYGTQMPNRFWSIQVPLWAPLLILAVLPARRARRAAARWRRVRRGLCAACGYDLRGSAASRCPECGAVRAALAG